jgi:hypothetical protein
MLLTMKRWLADVPSVKDARFMYNGCSSSTAYLSVAAKSCIQAGLNGRRSATKPTYIIKTPIPPRIVAAQARPKT